ncbi:MAG: T9SS type A sorting domain-containing protein, partial [Ignavibacterium sp.]
QIITEVEDHKPEFELSFKINANYPNPFNAFTRINFSLPEKTQVTAKVINMLGQVVDVIADNQSFGRGEHNIIWDAGNFGSGVYLFQISSNKYNAIHKMVMIK